MHALAEPSLKKRHARFALLRLAKLVDRNVLRVVLKRLDQLSEVSKDSVYYLRSFVSERHVQGAISAYLGTPREPGLESYQQAWLLAVMLEVLNQPPTEWVNFARWLAMDANQPRFIRILAFNVLALGHASSDVERLTTIAETNFDEGIVRGSLVALRRVDRLSRRTREIVLSRHPNLAATIEYLGPRDSLPSLVQSNLWNPIRSSR